MFPAIPEHDVEPVPKDISARSFQEIEPILPAFVRRSNQSSWTAKYEGEDLEIAVREVFKDKEEDGIYSFYRIESISDFLAIAVFLSSKGMKRFERPFYFFALPEHFVKELNLYFYQKNDDLKCKRVDFLHNHIHIDPDRKVPLFQEIRNNRWYNYRIAKPSMRAMFGALVEHRCEAYTPGPCISCSQQKIVCSS